MNRKCPFICANLTCPSSLVHTEMGTHTDFKVFELVLVLDQQPTSIKQQSHQGAVLM
jgi:hypothetical protein